MANLYRDAYWSQKDLDSHIGEAQKQATKCKMGCFSMDRMKYYNKQLCQRKEEGYRTSFIDLWGLMIEYLLNDGVWCIFRFLENYGFFSKSEWKGNQLIISENIPQNRVELFMTTDSDFLIGVNSLPREKCILHVNTFDCGCSRLNSGWYLASSGGNFGPSAQDADYTCKKSSWWTAQ